MTLSAFGVEDARISKADRRDKEIAGGTAAAGSAAPVFGALAIKQHRREKGRLREADAHMGEHWKDRAAGSRISADVHQGMAQGNLDLARKARKLKFIHGGAAGLAGAAALAGGTALGIRAHKRSS